MSIIIQVKLEKSLDVKTDNSTGHLPEHATLQSVLVLFGTVLTNQPANDIAVFLRYLYRCVFMCMSYNAVEVGIPQQHGAIVACRRVEVQDQSVGAVLLPADI